MTGFDRTGPQRFRGRLFLLLGLGLAVLGVVAYVVQISLERLMAPWYMPALASLGVVLVVMSVLERRTAWRGFALLAVVLLAGAEWQSCTRCDCRRTQGRSRWDDLSRRSKHHEPTGRRFRSATWLLTGATCWSSSVAGGDPSA